jgi:hypothetical protein
MASPTIEIETGKIETANAKLDGLDKRLDTQEFISR